MEWMENGVVFKVVFFKYKGQKSVHFLYLVPFTVVQSNEILHNQLPSEAIQILYLMNCPSR